jgi:chromosome segregation ATPase
VNSFGLMIESLVAILLIITIVYCKMFDRRLRRFKNDEAALRATIMELVAATESAERAIATLKVTVRDCDQNLAQQLRAAERCSAQLDRDVATGESVMRRLGHVLAPARASRPEAATKPSDTKDLLAAAEAFARRNEARLNGAAA